MGGLFIQMTGLSGAGKTTLARNVHKQLIKSGFNAEVIDGDEYRINLCKDLGFSKEDRNENIRRLSFVGKVLCRNSIIVIMSAINPYESIRKEISDDRTKLVYVKCSLSVLKNRDPKGLYKRALLPEGHPDYIPNFTGISDQFEEPIYPDLIIETDKYSIDECSNELKNFILNNLEH